MSVSTTAHMMFGADYNVFLEYIDEDELNDMLDDGELEYASPYYDSDRERWFVGGIVARSRKPIDEALLAEKRDQISKISLKLFERCFLCAVPDVS